MNYFQSDQELGLVLNDFSPLKLKPNPLIEQTIKLEKRYGSIDNIPNKELAKLHKLATPAQAPLSNEGVKKCFELGLSMRKTCKITKRSLWYVQKNFEKMKKATNKS